MMRVVIGFQVIRDFFKRCSCSLAVAISEAQRGAPVPRRRTHRICQSMHATAQLLVSQGRARTSGKVEHAQILQSVAGGRAAAVHEHRRSGALAGRHAADRNVLHLCQVRAAQHEAELPAASDRDRRDAHAVGGAVREVGVAVGHLADLLLARDEQRGRLAGVGGAEQRHACTHPCDYPGQAYGALWLCSGCVSQQWKSLGIHDVDIVHYVYKLMRTAVEESTNQCTVSTYSMEHKVARRTRDSHCAVVARRLDAAVRRDGDALGTFARPHEATEVGRVPLQGKRLLWRDVQPLRYLERASGDFDNTTCIFSLQMRPCEVN